ncbi:MAG: 4Fe-4S dicluster domain-containing protein [Deltaproteobacteria bacterium]|nr:4Fe-4S dicluster domain-containing protein [Deltaproteobacteria bacterium]
MAHRLVEQVRQAGVVGAGGAGFPTHVKLQASVDTYIANAAECEPLLYKDQELMRTQAERMVQGLRLGMEATGATRGVIAIKAKYKDAIAALGAHMGSDLEFHFFDSFYPAGDEYIVVYDVTGRLIPVPGIPLNVGCVVNNVETLINVANAAEGRPVTHTTLTVAGAVREPASLTVPVGVTAREVVDLAGGPTVPDVALLDGGAMMGKLVELDALVTKASGGYIVLPREHHLVRRRSRTEQAKVSIARSACDQCSYCTEFCPRFLLGYAIEPHKVMRSVGFAGEAEAGWAQLGLQCCECNLCSLYACPEDLPVMDMCVRSKQIWRQIEPRPDPLPPTGRAHPMRDHRRVPISRLVQRLGLVEWDVHAPLVDRVLTPEVVRLKLSQHLGAPAVPVVAVADRVSEGQLVAAIPEGKLGANIHASISGRVAFIDDTSIHIQR